MLWRNRSKKRSSISSLTIMITHTTPADNTTPHKASAYDQSVRQTIPFYETIHSEAIDLVRRAKPDVACWLDTGCGTGYLAELALPLFPRTQFILADPSTAMVQEAKKRFREEPESRLRFLPAVGSESLVFHIECESPQVVTAILCHHYLQAEQRREALRSCYQVLEDDGLLVTFEIIAPCTEIGTQIALERWGCFQTEQGRSPATVENHLKRFNTKYFPITVSEHLELLRAVGFRAVELFWLSQVHAGFYAIK